MSCDEERKSGCRKYFLMMLKAASEVFPRMNAQHQHERTRARFIKWHGGSRCESCEALEDRKD